jgi:hypothetical protein
VRGLGCPAGFVLTAGQKGDAPQASALLEAAVAEFVIADAAFRCRPLREAAAEKGAQAVIPNNPSPSLKYPLGPSWTWRSSQFGGQQHDWFAPPAKNEREGTEYCQICGTPLLAIEFGAIVTARGVEHLNLPANDTASTKTAWSECRERLEISKLCGKLTQKCNRGSLVSFT